MIAPFSFARTPEVHFGCGRFREIGRIAAKWGKSTVLLTGVSCCKADGNEQVLSEAMRKDWTWCRRYEVKGEPSPALVDEIVAECRHSRVDVVVAVGGGSVLDAGKAVSAMLMHAGSVADYLEGVGRKAPSGQKVPFVAVPTTAGTGSEASKNAVLSDTGANGFKKSLRHDNFVPEAALLDPALTLSCPPHVSAACGMDAFTQLLEATVSPKASPMTDSLAYGALPLLAEHLVDVCTVDPQNLEARAALSYASFISGVLLGNAGLGAVHGLAAPLGAFFPIPHGVVCGTLVGAATEANIEALRERDPSSCALKKYATVGYLLHGERGSDIERGCALLLERIEEWTDRLKIPLLSEYGVQEADIDRIVRGTESRNNPVELGPESLRRILRKRIR